MYGGGGQLSWGQLYGRGNFLGGKLSEVNYPGGNYPGGNYPGGNCPRTVKFPFFFFIILKITQIFCLKIIKSNIKQIQSQLAVAMVILWFLWNYLKLTKSEWLLLDFILT